MKQETKDLLHKMQARCDEATAGPWDLTTKKAHKVAAAPEGCPEYKEYLTVCTSSEHPQMRSVEPIIEEWAGFWGQYATVRPYNGEFIANARTDLPLVLGALGAVITECEVVVDTEADASRVLLAKRILALIEDALDTEESK